ncbi:MAG: ankyrin repeat domain-containing protein [Opitutaceae bacterium]
MDLARTAFRAIACLVIAFTGIACGADASAPAAEARETSVLFLAGPPSHGPGEHEFEAGCRLLADALTAGMPDVRTQVVVGWPEENILATVDALVIYSDGLGAHVAADHVSTLRGYARDGRGLVVLHFALEPSPGALADFMLETVGGLFVANWSVNPVWTVQDALLEPHAVTRGVSSLELEDEWYFHLRFAPDAVPLLRAVPPASAVGSDGPRSGNPAVRAAVARGEPQTLAWVREDAEVRAFGLTGAHFHRSWANDALRKLVLNGIVWAAGLEVPETGVVSKTAPIPHHGSIDEAIARGDLDDVRRHVAAHPERLQRGRNASLTPLHQAILRNKQAIAMFLLEAGADANALDGSGRTPAHMAIERGNVDVLKMLIRHGAGLDRWDARGWTPLHHAAARDRVELATALLDGGADLARLSELGGTALHEAAASGGESMIRLLLARGVDPSVVSSTGVTALDIAREYKNEAAIAILSSNVANGAPTERAVP